ncbi:MAG: prepilin-type N-terminal cleavage/methylation domain-containing protein [Puniceicoccales bacterium]|jgi:prepilin-type N-terminal cleavage/methylation domain-containing protein|nr:prepilin-type N-terminal cleavage/methylation domain-containing protein [Puniceicoccales bacterium]
MTLGALFIKNTMGTNKQQSGFSIVELLFTLAIMATFMTCFIFKPFKFKEDAVYKAKIALSEAIFLARLHSIASDSLVTFSLKPNREKYVIELECKPTPGRVEYIHKEFDPGITDCKLLDFPQRCADSDGFMANFIEGGSIKPEQVIFKEKFFTPFQLKFLFDGKTRYFTIDKNAQIQIY